MTKEQSIVLDFILMLKSISIVNGYLTNCGSNVLHWAEPIIPIEEDERISVNDTGNDNEEEYENEDKSNLQLKIFFGCAKKENTWLNLTNMKADILKCIGNNWKFFSQKYDNVKFNHSNDEREIQKDERIFGEASMLVTCGFPVNKFLIDDRDYYPEPDNNNSFWTIEQSED